MNEPLAQRLRPKTLADVCGQQHLLAEGQVFRRTIESGRIPTMTSSGPSGTGKTTVARIIAENSGMTLHKLNGTSCGTGDIKAVLKDIGTLAGAGGILLYLDEIQYLNKKQQQSLLECIEDGSVTLIASTTENPYFYIYNALLSRCTVFEFKSLSAADVERGIRNALKKLSESESQPVVMDEDACAYLAESAGGDLRKALGCLDFVVTAAPVDGTGKHITLEMIQQVTRRTAMRYDRDGDDHYDIVSAYQKSMRGSDPDAALHYLARLLEAGDLPSACRRLMVCACEDVGLAYPQIIPIVKAAVDAAPGKFDADAHHALARRAAAQSIVLLKNENSLLPLAKGEKVAVIGDFAQTPRYQGAGSSAVNSIKVDSFLDCLAESGLNSVGYAKGFDRQGKPDEALKAEAVLLAKNANVVLLCMGLDEIKESEGIDRADMKLAENQLELLTAVAAANPNVVLLLSAGSSLESDWVKDCKALVYGCLGGQAGAGALVEVLTGAQNPCGKLAETWARSYADTPAKEHFGGDGPTVEYREGLYVGYRYYDTAGVPTAFPFGYGLSYTSFAYSDLKADEKGATLTVTNTGSCAGAEVVQGAEGLCQGAAGSRREQDRHHPAGR